MKEEKLPFYEITDFLYHLKGDKRLSDNTINAYKKDIIDYGNFLVTYQNVYDVTEIDKEMIDKYIKSLKRRELKKTSITRKISVIKAFHHFLKEDKIVDGQIALPAGSVIRGTINKITPSKRLSRSAVIYFSFDHVVTPNGKQVPISAGLYGYSELTLDGGIYSGGNYGYAIQENWANAKNIVGKAINWGKGTGENLQYVFVPVGAIGGSIGGMVYYVGADIVDLFKKGNEVTLPAGTNLEILLTQPLDIPLH